MFKFHSLLNTEHPHVLRRTADTDVDVVVPVFAKLRALLDTRIGGMSLFMGTTVTLIVMAVMNPGTVKTLALAIDGLVKNLKG